MMNLYYVTLDLQAVSRDYPGDCLTLQAEEGWVTAEINFCRDRAETRLPAELFLNICRRKRRCAGNGNNIGKKGKCQLPVDRTGRRISYNVCVR